MKKMVLDFNHGSGRQNNIRDIINNLIDKSITQGTEKPRNYLGALRLGVACSRALQFEYTSTPKDEGQEFSAKILRIFQAGHVFEDLAINWLRTCGIDLRTKQKDGTQFGFSAAEGQLKGHVDGIIINAPEELGFSFPMLWECKSMNNRPFNETVKKGLTLSKPIYAAQIAVYQAYMESAIAGISKNPALFTAINKDNAELYHELIPFDAVLAQKMSDKAVNIITATKAKELLPKISNDPSYFECKFCPWQKRCGRY